MGNSKKSGQNGSKIGLHFQKLHEREKKTKRIHVLYALNGVRKVSRVITIVIISFAHISNNLSANIVADPEVLKQNHKNNKRCGVKKSSNILQEFGKTNTYIRAGIRLHFRQKNSSPFRPSHSELDEVCEFCLPFVYRFLFCLDVRVKHT